MLFGAHVSIAGGIFNAPLNAATLGTEVFQMFTRSPHGGPVNPLTPDAIALFKQNMALTGQVECYVHTPYFINFASGNNRIKYGSISVVREELERASALGATYLMTHLGSYKDLGKEKGFKQLVECLDKALKGYKGSTQFLIEISAGSGEVIGSQFDDMAEIIHHKLLKKYKIGICFDTAHAFASGHDLRSPAVVSKTFGEFDKTIGLDRLKMFHCNDSKVEFNAHVDRHQHIGDGFIGTAGFEAIFSYKKIQHCNFILETEHDKVRQDLALVKKLREKIL